MGDINAVVDLYQTLTASIEKINQIIIESQNKIVNITSNLSENMNQIINNTSQSLDTLAASSTKAYESLDGLVSTTINEKLNALTADADKVVQVIGRLESVSDNASGKLDELEKSSTRLSNGLEKITEVEISEALDDLKNSASKASKQMIKLANIEISETLDAIEESANKASEGIEKLASIDATGNLVTLEERAEKVSEAINKIGAVGGKDDLDDVGKSASKTSERIAELAKKIFTLDNAKKIMDIGDAFTQTNEKLKLINGGQEVDNELQNKIYGSANKSRSTYKDTVGVVSDLGTKAGDSFGSTDELIAFSELMQKGVKVGGTSSENQTTSMSYLTDAMGTGELGEEAFLSIMGAAPGIAEAISKYTGKSNEDLLSMASKGLLTSEILKNAMFASSDKINEKFRDMPVTFAQAWTLIQNDLLHTFQPLIEKIAEGASWIADNWSSITPIFVGAAGAVGAYASALGIMKIITLASEIATKGLNATLNANPLILIVTIIGLVIGVIYKWIQSVGGFKIAWLIVVDRVMYAWDWLKIGFFTGVYFVMGLLDKLQIGFMKMSVAISNFVGDMKVDFLNTFQNMVNGAIDIINGFLKKVSGFTGISFDLIEHVTFATDAAIENEVEKQARDKGLENYIAEKEALIEERDGKIKTMKQEALDNHLDRLLEIASLQAESAEKEDNSYDYDLYKEQSSLEDPIIVEGTGSGGAVSVDMAEQDLQYLRDMAERDYINKFSTATLAPNISVKFTGAISKDVDTDSMYRRIGKILTEEIAMVAEGVY